MIQNTLLCSTVLTLEDAAGNLTAYRDIETIEGESHMGKKTADITIGYSITVPEVLGTYSSLKAELKITSHNEDVTDGFEKVANALASRVYAQTVRQVDRGLEKLGLGNPVQDKIKSGRA